MKKYLFILLTLYSINTLPMFNGLTKLAAYFTKSSSMSPCSQGTPNHINSSPVRSIEDNEFVFIDRDKSDSKKATESLQNENDNDNNDTNDDEQATQSSEKLTLSELKDVFSHHFNDLPVNELTNSEFKDIVETFDYDNCKNTKDILGKPDAPFTDAVGSKVKEKKICKEFCSYVESHLNLHSSQNDGYLKTPTRLTKSYGKEDIVKEFSEEYGIDVTSIKSKLLDMIEPAISKFERKESFKSEAKEYLKMLGRRVAPRIHPNPEALSHSEVTRPFTKNQEEYLIDSFCEQYNGQHTESREELLETLRNIDLDSLDHSESENFTSSASYEDNSIAGSSTGANTATESQFGSSEIDSEHSTTQSELKFENTLKENIELEGSADETTSDNNLIQSEVADDQAYSDHVKEKIDSSCKEVISFTNFILSMFSPDDDYYPKVTGIPDSKFTDLYNQVSKDIPNPMENLNNIDINWFRSTIKQLADEQEATDEDNTQGSSTGGNTATEVQFENNKIHFEDNISQPDPTLQKLEKEIKLESSTSEINSTDQLQVTTQNVFQVDPATNPSYAAEKFNKRHQYTKGSTEKEKNKQFQDSLNIIFSEEADSLYEKYQTLPAEYQFNFFLEFFFTQSQQVYKPEDDITRMDKYSFKQEIQAFFKRKADLSKASYKTRKSMPQFWPKRTKEERKKQSMEYLRNAILNKPINYQIPSQPLPKNFFSETSALKLQNNKNFLTK